MANGAMDRRFALAGQQLRRQEQSQAEKEKEALRRRFASTGSLGSGASIKAEQMAQQESSKRFGEGSRQLEMAKLGEQARQEEIEQARAFQMKEREATQKYGTGEREASQLFAAEQAGLGREFTTSEREAAQKYGSIEARRGRDFAAEQNRMNRRLQQQGIDLQREEFEINKLVSLFNMGGDYAESVRQLFAKLVPGAHPYQYANVKSGGNVMPSVSIN